VSRYTAEKEGMPLSLGEKGKIVSLTHHVEPYSEEEGRRKHYVTMTKTLGSGVGIL